MGFVPLRRATRECIEARRQAANIGTQSDRERDRSSREISKAMSAFKKHENEIKNLQEKIAELEHQNRQAICQRLSLKR